MRDALAERLLATVMDWSAEDVARERPRLQALATFKYDEYQQYTPGERFVERLARWLWRFDPDERQSAYRFVLTRLVFISNAEMQHFIAMAYRDRLRPYFVAETAEALGVPAWRQSVAAAHCTFRHRARRCLFLGLSDGARLDVFRRSAHELFSTEQFFASYEVPRNRCEELQSSLATDLAALGSTDEARFHTIVLLDDFAGSGMSFVRQTIDVLAGKFVKFLNEIRTPGSHLANIVDQSHLKIVVLYYVASSAAVSYLTDRFAALEAQYALPIRLETVHTISSSIVLHRDDMSDDFVRILRRHYDPAAEDRHTATGHTDLVVGYADGGLPLVLSHNTPNNAPSLLWFERDGRIPALFPRVTRHADVGQEA